MFLPGNVSRPWGPGRPLHFDLFVGKGMSHDWGIGRAGLQKREGRRKKEDHSLVVVLKSPSQSQGYTSKLGIEGKDGKSLDRH